MALKNTRDKVLPILAEKEKARNNDNVLVAHYIARYCSRLVTIDQDGDKVIKLKHFEKLPPLENVRRSRAVIQNKLHRYPPTDPRVIKARRQKEINWRDAEVREAGQ